MRYLQPGTSKGDRDNKGSPRCAKDIGTHDGACIDVTIRQIDERRATNQADRPTCNCDSNLERRQQSQRQEYIETFLESDRLNAKTDDDKTMLLCLAVNEGED